MCQNKVEESHKIDLADSMKKSKSQMNVEKLETRGLLNAASHK